MIGRKWPGIKLRTILLLAIAMCIVAILLFVPRVEEKVSRRPAVPFVKNWTVFLFNVYGAKGIEFLHPMSVFADDLTGLLYVVNTEKHRVDVFDNKGSFEFSFGDFGTGKGQLSFPYGLAKTPGGNLLVTESGNGRIQEFTPDGKSLGFLVDKNNIIGMRKPGPIRIDSLGKLYVGDLSAGKVFILSKQGRQINTINGITHPHGIAVDEKNNRLYVASASSGDVKTYPLDEHEQSNIQKTSFVNLGLIRGIDVDSNGNLYVVNSLQSSIMVFDETGNPLNSFGQRGHEDGQMLYPNGIDVADNGRVYIADWGNNRINIWEFSGL